jgi:hypothetical protein
VAADRAPASLRKLLSLCSIVSARSNPFEIEPRFPSVENCIGKSTRGVAGDDVGFISLDWDLLDCTVLGITSMDHGDDLDFP